MEMSELHLCTCVRFARDVQLAIFLPLLVTKNTPHITLLSFNSKDMYSFQKMYKLFPLYTTPLSIYPSPMATPLTRPVATLLCLKWPQNLLITATKMGKYVVAYENTRRFPPPPLSRPQCSHSIFTHSTKRAGQEVLRGKECHWWHIE